METIETDDLYRGASLLCLGAELSGINKQGKNVIFTLMGNGISRFDYQYRTGKAMVNPLQLKETLSLLRDLIFSNGNKEMNIWRKQDAVQPAAN